MLKKVVIKNFLSCVDTEIDFDDVTVLIGRNGAGKTNILRIIYVLAQVLAGDLSVSILLDERNSNFPNDIVVNFLISNEEFSYSFKFDSNNSEMLFVEKFSKIINATEIVLGEKSNQAVIVYEKDSVVQFKIAKEQSLIIAALSILNSEDGELEEFKNLSNFWLKVTYYDFDYLDKNSEQLNSIGYISESRYEKWVSDKANQDSFLNIKILDFSLNDRIDTTFYELKELLGKRGVDVIDDIVVKQYDIGIENNKEKLYIVKYAVNGNYLDYEQLSFGTRRVLSILLAVLYDDNRVILLEQPEDGIHHWLLQKLISICLTYCEDLNKQLIIATHSAEVVNLVKAHQVRLVEMTDNGTKVNKLDNELIALVPEYIANEGTLFDLIESMEDR